MVTSTPAPPDPPESPASSPRQETLVTVAAQVAAIDTLIGLAQRSIRVFDIDLSDMGWNEAARAEKIVAFLRARRSSRLEIILHDTGWIERSCPRISNLLKYYSHAVAILRTGQEARHAMDPLVIVDDTHFLHRFHIAQPRAEFAIDAPLAAKPLIDRFDAIRASAEPGLSASVLGL